MFSSRKLEGKGNNNKQGRAGGSESRKRRTAELLLDFLLVSLVLGSLLLL